MKDNYFKYFSLLNFWTAVEVSGELASRTQEPFKNPSKFRREEIRIILFEEWKRSWTRRVIEIHISSSASLKREAKTKRTQIFSFSVTFAAIQRALVVCYSIVERMIKPSNRLARDGVESRQGWIQIRRGRVNDSADYDRLQYIWHSEQTVFCARTCSSDLARSLWSW